MYKHDIKALILYAESLNIPFVVPDYIRKNSDIISDWEAGRRYDVAFSIRIDTLKKMQDILDEWYEQELTKEEKSYIRKAIMLFSAGKSVPEEIKKHLPRKVMA